MKSQWTSPRVLGPEDCVVSEYLTEEAGTHLLKVVFDQDLLEQKNPDLKNIVAIP